MDNHQSYCNCLALASILYTFFLSRYYDRKLIKQSLPVSGLFRISFGLLFQLIHVDPSFTLLIIDVRVTKTNKNFDTLFKWMYMYFSLP